MNLLLLDLACVSIQDLESLDDLALEGIGGLEQVKQLALLLERERGGVEREREREVGVRIIVIVMMNRSLFPKHKELRRRR
jgi:hypothetical protein